MTEHSPEERPKEASGWWAVPDFVSEMSIGEEVSSTTPDGRVWVGATRLTAAYWSVSVRHDAVRDEDLSDVHGSAVSAWHTARLYLYLFVLEYEAAQEEKKA